MLVFSRADFDSSKLKAKQNHLGLEAASSDEIPSYLLSTVQTGLVVPIQHCGDSYLFHSYLAEVADLKL